MNINQKINSSSLNSAKLMIEELSNRYNYKENLFNTLSENLKKQQRLSDSLNLAIKRINDNPLNSRLSTVKEIQKSSFFSLPENLREQQRLSDSLNLAIKRINENSLNSRLSTVKEIQKSSSYLLSENLRKQQRLSDSLNLAIKRINDNPLNSYLSTVKEIQKSSSYLLSENLRKQQHLSDSLNVVIKRINDNPLNSLLSTAKEIQKSGSFSLSENLKNQDLISDSLKLAIRRVNEYYSNSFSSITKKIEKSSTFSSPIRSYNKMISEALKFDNIKIPVELISLELPKIEDVIIVSKPHMPEKIQEEIELEFDGYFKENNEIINNSILDMESIRKIILNRYLNFLLSILVLMIQFYSDNKVYHLLINAVFLIHSFFLTSDK